jgi:hypothetical protein
VIKQSNLFFISEPTMNIAYMIFYVITSMFQHFFCHSLVCWKWQYDVKNDALHVRFEYDRWWVGVWLRCIQPKTLKWIQCSVISRLLIFDHTAKVSYIWQRNGLKCQKRPHQFWTCAQRKQMITRIRDIFINLFVFKNV